MKLLKEPFLHFVSIGFLLFLLYYAVSPGSEDHDRKIVVDTDRVNNLTARFQQVWHREPSAEELKGLIDEFVIEEIYYRQALAMGMDKDDPVIRRQLRQKMEFLAQSTVIDLQPDDAVLQGYLDANQDAFRQEAVLSFEQLFLSAEKSPAELEQRIKAMGTALARGETPPGDPSLLPEQFDSVGESQIDQIFGNGFAAQLSKLNVASWSAPLRSGVGVHLVRVLKRIDARTPTLPEVREEVLQAWRHDQQQRQKSERDSKLLAEYQVELSFATDANQG